MEEQQMAEQRFSGKRALITQADEFMGPALCEVFAEQGAEVIAATGPLAKAQRAQQIVAAAGRVDVLIANLAVPAPSTRAQEVSDDEWRHVFAHMVDPLPRLFRAVLPQMLERRAGKIVLMGSASALHGMKHTSSYFQLLPATAQRAAPSWLMCR